MSEEEEGIKKCPYCAETIKEEAIKCRFCLTRLDGERESLSLENILGSKEEAYYYPKAGLVKRFLGWIVDTIIATIVAIILLPLMGASFFLGRTLLHGMFNTGIFHGGMGFDFVPFTRAVLIIPFIILSFVWFLLYILFKDGLGNGQSLGKRLVGLMVVNLTDNKPCEFRTSGLRNIIKLLLNFIPHVGWLVEPIVVVAQDKGRRLGDMIAKTQVIEKEQYYPEEN